VIYSKRLIVLTCFHMRCKSIVIRCSEQRSLPLLWRFVISHKCSREGRHNAIFTRSIASDFLIRIVWGRPWLYICVLIVITHMSYTISGAIKFSLSARNDILVLAPSEGPASHFSHEIGKGDPNLLLMLHWRSAFILERSQNIRCCSIGWDFSIWGVLEVVSEGSDLQIVFWKDANERKAFPFANTPLLSHWAFKFVKAFERLTWARIKEGKMIRRKGKGRMTMS
jgi:hypothetical protein